MILKTFSQSFPHVQLWYFLPAYKRGPFNTILIGSREQNTVDYKHISRQFAENPGAYQSLVPYGLTSAEAVLPQYVADETVIRNAVKTASLNSLDHPRYEFFYPWDYAIDKEKKFIANHDFILKLKREAYPDYLESLEKGMHDTAKLRQTLAAEFRYLEGFRQFLAGISLTEQYRIFDDALAVAPWNDSLRARIFAQYLYIASTRKNPAERARLMQRAHSLYDTKQGIN